MSEKQVIRAGGQAIIEGVMMLVNGGWAIAVRKKSGEIVVQSKPYKRLTQRKKIFNIPLIRGILSFVEMLNLGLDSINRSADIYYEEEAQNSGSLKEKILSVLSMILALVIGVGMFMYLPILLGNLLNMQDNQLLFNLFLGGIRMVFFIVYILLISLMKDIKRFFMYHGAEHKVVYAFEHNEHLVPDNIRKYSTKHPRCGTSFIFIVLMTAIVFYALIDTLVFSVWGIPNTILYRLINHLILLPVVAALAFEILTLAGKFFHNPIVKILVLPGLLFQYITTKEPTDDMIEVAVESLNAALKEAGMTDAD